FTVCTAVGGAGKEVPERGAQRRRISLLLTPLGGAVSTVGGISIWRVPGRRLRRLSTGGACASERRVLVSMWGLARSRRVWIWYWRHHTTRLPAWDGRSRVRMRVMSA